MAVVLVVDDSATSREVLRATLDHAGHIVIEAANARRALTLADESHPDLIITDVLMPGMDGYSFVRKLRASPDTTDIPVVFFTANYRPEEAGPLAAAHGVATVLAKSAEPDELLAAVDGVLRQAPEPATVPEAPATVTDIADLDLAARHLQAVNAKLVEKALALDESQAQLLTVAELSPFGIVVATPAGLATYVNPRLSEITGRPAADLLGTGWQCCLPATRRAAMLVPRSPAGNAAVVEPLRCRSDIALGDRSPRWLDVTIRHMFGADWQPGGFVAMIDDVTSVVEAAERERLAEREREAEQRQQMVERFDSLARLAGAVAHDFNNLLNVILSFDEFAQEAVTDAVGSEFTAAQAEMIRADLDRINQAGRRAAHLAHQLLTFGGREIVQPAVIEVKDVIDAMREMLDGSIGRQFLLRTDLAPDLWRIRADESQLCQVLLNLALNARDAMPGDGQLLIRARKWTGEVANLGPGEYVHIEVIDDGDGMAPEVVRQAIEPFFTTKPKGSGAGLGLATAYGIVKQAGGDLTIESTPGTGTTVHLYFPASDEPVEPVAPHVSPEAPAGRTILVAEDEDALREVAVRMLTSAGYRVLAAANGEEALAVARDNPEGIDAVLTDVVMPRMNGPELAQALRAVRPALPILYMSGYAAPLMTDQGLLEPGVTVLSKPFTKAELLDTLANCITV